MTSKSTWKRARVRLLPVVLLPLLIGSSLFSGAANAKNQDTVSLLHGLITSTSGSPVAGAFISVDGARTRANSRGRYSLTVPGGDLAVVSHWAPGYTESVVSVDLRTVSGGFTLNFSGSIGLRPAFSNGTYGASMSPLPASVPSSTRTIRVHGNSEYPLYGRIAVTLPNGRVHLYRMQLYGHSFAANIPLSHKGIYRFEILSASALAIFNVLVARGVPASLPADPLFADDPAGASTKALSAFGPRLINSARAAAGLPAFHSKAKLFEAAQGHVVDMISHGYFYSHPHVGSDGSSAAQRVKRTGFYAKAVGEDVGSAQSVRMMIIEWLQSPLHRGNILENYR